MKFKRFVLIKTEGKGDGEFYRIPVALLILLFLLLLSIIIAGVVLQNSQKSPQVIRREQLIQMRQENYELDTVLHSLKRKMDTTGMNSTRIFDRAEELRKKASFPDPVKSKEPIREEPLSHAFLQSYTDTLNKFLAKSARSGSPDFWHSLPTISPLRPGDGSIIIGFGVEFESFSGVKMKNRGVTFAVEKGKPVYATASGVVRVIGKDPLKGLFIEIDHGRNLITRYSHLNATAIGRGNRVRKGEIIGQVGESGWSVGPQLLYEITKNGKPVDPTLLVQENL